MAVIGTFGSFTAARLGIYASQASLSATGNNIANINTVGYTRQRMDLVSLYSYGTIRYANNYQQNIGYGVLTSSVSQLRDPFLDIRYREENASMGAFEAKLDCLQQLASKLDEVGKGTDDFGIVERQFNDFFSQLENLLGRVGDVTYDTTVRGSAQTLTNLFNDYSKAMDTLGENKLKELKENIETVNSLLTRIRELNVQIRDAGIAGDNALELRDDRNLCIDELSAYMKINVSYDMEKIDEFNSVERLNISIADSGNPPIKLIQGIYGAQISMYETAPARNPYYDPDYESKSTTDDPYEDPDYEKKSSKFVILDETGNIKGYTNYARNPNYNPDATSGNESKEYMYFNSETGTYTYMSQEALDAQTPAPVLATDVNNAVEGKDDNRLWMTVEPLTDAKGNYMRDENHKQIKTPVDLSDTQLYGSLQSIREFLTERGEFSSDYDRALDAGATQKRGLQYYKNSLDALARKFAEAFNNANRLDLDQVTEAYEMVEDPAGSGTWFFLDKDGNQIPPASFVDSEGNQIDFTQFGSITDSEGNTVTVTDAASFFKALTSAVQDLEELKKIPEKKRSDDEKDKIKELEDFISKATPTAYDAMEVLREQGQLTEKWSFYKGGVLFSNNGDTNDPTGITAGNITISTGWNTGDVRILNTKHPTILGNSTANDNIYHMIELMSEDMDYFPNEILDGVTNNGETRYFNGSFQERLADMNSLLAVETETTNLLYNNYTATTLSLENSRQSVAGVDLNDEATSMMMFQKSYAAACQLMTTLDSMLDKLINGTLR